MYTPAPLNVPSKAVAPANDVATHTDALKPLIEDQRPEAIVQKRLKVLMGESKQAQHMQAVQKMAHHKSEKNKPPFRSQRPSLQAVFDQQSVHEALIDATGPANDMGGTTGGAYRVKTSVGDPDRDPLVVKISGSTGAVLASQVGVAIGIATPNSVMVNAEPKVLGTMKRLGVRGLGDQTRFEVQQYADLNKIPNKPDPTEKTVVSVGKIAVFDTLMGNHDRIHSINKDNLIGAIAIDNTTHNNSATTEKMMEQVIGALAHSDGKLIDYVEQKIAPFSNVYQESYKGSKVKQLQGLEIQLAMFREAINIQRNGEALRELVAQHELAEKANTQHSIDELKRLQVLKEPDLSSSLELVIQKIVTKNGMTREYVIESNLGQAIAGLDKPRFKGVLDRLKVIEETDFREALAATQKAIEVLKAAIAEDDQQRMNVWNEKEKAALASSKKVWDDKFFKFYTTEKVYVGELMTQWRNANPKPLPTNI
jgi:hypothetical protein